METSLIKRVSRNGCLLKKQSIRYKINGLLSLPPLTMATDKTLFCVFSIGWCVLNSIIIGQKGLSVPKIF